MIALPWLEGPGLEDSNGELLSPFIQTLVKIPCAEVAERHIRGSRRDQSGGRQSEVSMFYSMADLLKVFLGASSLVGLWVNLFKT